MDNQSAIDAALRELEAIGGTWRVVPNSTRLWVHQGRATDAAFRQAVAAIEAAGRETYTYLVDEDNG